MEFKKRLANYVKKVVAFIAHARVPDFRIGFPGLVGKFVGIVGHM
jgi:hypothetical protein